MDQNSESLLTQILYLVQDLHNDMAVHNERLSQCEQLTGDLQIRLQNVVNTAFPDGDIVAHRMWHEANKLGPIRRFIIKLLS